MARFNRPYCVLLIVSCVFSRGLLASPVTEPVSFDAVMALPVSRVYEHHRYGPDALQTVTEVGAVAPLKTTVVLIHGGCWSNTYSHEHTLPMAESLARHGYDVWVPEYRRVGDQGGGWPGSLQDITTAVNFVKASTGVRPILIGHSAGRTSRTQGRARQGSRDQRYCCTRTHYRPRQLWRTKRQLPVHGGAFHGRSRLST